MRAVLRFFPCVICKGERSLRTWLAGRPVLRPCFHCKGRGFRPVSLESANEA